MKKGIFVIPLIVSAACVGGVLAFSPSASAAIDGENGPIVYIDNQVPTENENGNNEDRAVIRQEDTVSQVITTAPDGSNQQVVQKKKTLSQQQVFLLQIAKAITILPMA